MSDSTPKSAYELAMERLRKRDAEEGVSIRPLTEAQREAIAEVRRFYEAKLAQEDVLHQSKLRSTFEPAEREQLGEQFQRERERLVRERDAKIEKIRRADS
jgi:hypothetical protein